MIAEAAAPQACILSYEKWADTLEVKEEHFNSSCKTKVGSQDDFNTIQATINQKNKLSYSISEEMGLSKKPEKKPDRQYKFKAEYQMRPVNEETRN